MTGIRLATANDAEGRDPASYALYGSNVTVTVPADLEFIDWNLISEGPLSLPTDRNTWMDAPIVFSNSTAYTHYKLMFPTVKNPENGIGMQIAEIELLEAPEAGWFPVIDAGADQSLVLPNNTVVLNGTVQDDGLPLPDNPGSPSPSDPNKLRWEWTVVSVPQGSSGIQWTGNSTMTGHEVPGRTFFGQIILHF